MDVAPEDCAVPEGCVSTVSSHCLIKGYLLCAVKMEKADQEEVASGSPVFSFTSVSLVLLMPAPGEVLSLICHTYLCLGCFTPGGAIKKHRCLLPSALPGSSWGVIQPNCLPCTEKPHHSDV